MIETYFYRTEIVIVKYCADNFKTNDEGKRKIPG